MFEDRAADELIIEVSEGCWDELCHGWESNPCGIDGRISVGVGLGLGLKSDSDANAGSPRVGRRVRFGYALKVSLGDGV